MLSQQDVLKGHDPIIRNVTRTTRFFVMTLQKTQRRQVLSFLNDLIE